jgi:hypothetical protein
MPTGGQDGKVASNPPSLSDCQRIFQAYEVILGWVSRGAHEWPGNHEEVRAIIQESDWNKPALRPFLEDINTILNFGHDAFKTAKFFLRTREVRRFKSAEEMCEALNNPRSYARKKMRSNALRQSRSSFFEDLATRGAVSQSGKDDLAALRWCLKSCYDTGVTPTEAEISKVFARVGRSTPAPTKFLTRWLFADRRKTNSFSSLWEEALAQFEYNSIRQEELARARQQALRAKVRAEIEDEVREKTRKELGFRETSDEQRFITESVKFEVWRRDGGKCVKCGSQRGLEFDHIIPFSKGGSNTARNIQLLCENCNRSKSNNI